MTDEKFSVFDALTQVRRQMPAITKDHNAPAAQGGYAFAGIESYLAAANPLMDAAGLHLIPHSILAERVTERPISNRIMYCTYVTVLYRIYGPAGDYIEGEALGEAADVGDKATPKALTAARKAFLKEMLRITSEGDDADAGDPAPTVQRHQWAEMGWADQLEHDHARHSLLERIQLQAEDVKAEIKESVSRAGMSWARPMTRAELDTITSWLPSESRETPPAAQDGPATPEAGGPLPGEYPDAPEGVTSERWHGALAVVDSMRLSDLMASLSDHGLGTKGTEAERRIRLAVAIASEAVPN